MTASVYSLELCAGAGGQALGLERAGFKHVALAELDRTACGTLRQNRPNWSVLQRDIRDLNGANYRGIDLLSGGVPCPPFSIAGLQLGGDDARDLFPEAMRIVREAHPRAVMLENVRGFAAKKFAGYRADLLRSFADLGYEADWRVLEAADFGVAQLRPRFILIALRAQDFKRFRWPTGGDRMATVGSVLRDLMAARGWPGARDWAAKASSIGPTIVGGSQKHGGPDLGPTRARRQWGLLGVDGRGIVADSPSPDFPSNGAPRLTIPMVARLQGFPDSWQFVGGKTAAYRQLGNALPPPVAEAVGAAIAAALGRRVVNPEEAILSLSA